MASITQILENKWVVNSGKFLGILTAAFISYQQATSESETKGNHLESKAAAGYSQTADAIKKLEEQRVLQEKAIIELKAEVALLSRIVGTVTSSVRVHGATIVPNRSQPKIPSVSAGITNRQEVKNKPLINLPDNLDAAYEKASSK